MTTLEKYSNPWILEKAKSGLTVHKYKYSQERLRKKTRRFCKDGVLIMENQTKDCFYYKLAEQ